MSTVHDFKIPHEYVQPTRDMVIVRLPMPPKMVGQIHIPDVSRDMMQHNVMAARIVAMGPMAFMYKDGEGLTQQKADIGDWVIIRPFAGTMVQGGELQATAGWRYVSSFQDVIGVIPFDKMPDPATLIWDDAKAPARQPEPAPPAVTENVRERVIYKKEG